MGLFLTILLNLLLIVLLFILLILLLPFNYKSYLEIKDSNLEGYLKGTWAFGFLGFLLCLGSERKISFLIFNFKILSKNINTIENNRKKNTKAKKLIKGKKRKKKIKFEKELIAILKNFILKILNIIGPKHFKIIGIYGFSDPSFTGKFSAILWTLKSILPYKENYIFNLNPIFNDEILDLNISLKGGFSLGEVVFQTILLFLKRPIRKIIF